MHIFNSSFSISYFFIFLFQLNPYICVPIREDQSAARMAKLVNVAVSEAVGSSPLRVRVSLRAQTQKCDSNQSRIFF